MAKLRATDAEIAGPTLRPVPESFAECERAGNIGRLNVNNSPYFPVTKLTLAQSKREETAAALKERRFGERQLIGYTAGSDRGCANGRNRRN